MSSRRIESDQPNLLNSSEIKSDENHYPLTEKQGQVADSEVRSDTNKSANSGIKKYWWLIPVLGIVVAIAGVTSNICAFARHRYRRYFY